MTFRKITDGRRARSHALFVSGTSRLVTKRKRSDRSRRMARNSRRAAGRSGIDPDRRRSSRFSRSRWCFSRLCPSMRRVVCRLPLPEATTIESLVQSHRHRPRSHISHHAGDGRGKFAERRHARSGHRSDLRPRFPALRRSGNRQPRKRHGYWRSRGRWPWIPATPTATSCCRQPAPRFRLIRSRARHAKRWRSALPRPPGVLRRARIFAIAPSLIVTPKTSSIMMTRRSKLIAWVMCRWMIKARSSGPNGNPGGKPSGWGAPTCRPQHGLATSAIRRSI